MKTLFKVMIILVAAVLVGGLLYGAVTTFSAGSTEQVSAAERPSNTEFSRVDRPTPAAGLQLPLDSVRNLVIISMIVVAYVNLSKWIKMRVPTPVRVRS